MDAAAAAPEFLAIGHATRDLLPDGGWRLGGTVSFAALAAQRLGLRAAILTSGPTDVLDALATAVPGVALRAIASEHATTFENLYTDGRRSQYLRDRATPLLPEHVPAAWRGASIVLLAPLAREVAPEMAGIFPDALRGATPQGWLRQWDADGAVSPAPLGDAEDILGELDALILSIEDLVTRAVANDVIQARAEAANQLTTWVRRVPLVIATAGSEGAYLYRRDQQPERFAAYPAREVDPTGAGDVFAAAFLCHLRASDDPSASIRFANQVASLSVEQRGIAGVPTRAEVAARFGGE